MTYALYQNINQLEDTAFIAGTQFVFSYTVTEADGITPVNLSGATVRTRFSPYGQSDYCVLDKAGLITGANSFTVTLGAADTQSWAGKYIQQVYIKSFTNIEYRPAQGVVLVSPRIVT